MREEESGRRREGGRQEWSQRRGVDEGNERREGRRGGTWCLKCRDELSLYLCLLVFMFCYRECLKGFFIFFYFALGGIWASHLNLVLKGRYDLCQSSYKCRGGGGGYNFTCSFTDQGKTGYDHHSTIECVMCVWKLRFYIRRSVILIKHQKMFPRGEPDSLLVYLLSPVDENLHSPFKTAQIGSDRTDWKKEEKDENDGRAV